MALQTLKAAFNTDVEPILAMARYRAGGANDPVGVYRLSDYRHRMADAARPPRGWVQESCEELGGASAGNRIRRGRYLPSANVTPIVARRKP
jgi:hypothetical protein